MPGERTSRCSLADNEKREVSGAASFWSARRSAAGFDRALGLAQRPLFAVDLRHLPDPTVARWLAGTMPVWSIGFAFSDEAGAKVSLAPARAFDIVGYLDRVTGAPGLSR